MMKAFILVALFEMVYLLFVLVVCALCFPRRPIGRTPRAFISTSWLAGFSVGFEAGISERDRVCPPAQWVEFRQG